jgi:16S rRNA (guanine966-N2)-methyltransferase
VRIVAGKFRGKQLNTPKGGDIRPTADRVREAVFSIIGSRLGPTLDGHCVFVDTGVEARGLMREHIQDFGVAGQVKLLRRDATDMGPSERIRPSSLVFADPPYGQELGEKAIASALKGGWIAPGALIVLEERKDAEITAPEGTDIVDRREYGDTAVTFLLVS